jgi:hypothetical protein
MEIAEGALVRYSGTGTVGVVKAITEDEAGKWAFLDSTGLYYKVETLEPIDKIPERKELGGATVEEIKRKIAAHQEMMDAAKMQDETLETGG